MIWTSRIFGPARAEEIFPYVCLADIALSDAFGWGSSVHKPSGMGVNIVTSGSKKVLILR